MNHRVNITPLNECEKKTIRAFFVKHKNRTPRASHNYLLMDIATARHNAILRKTRNERSARQRRTIIRQLNRLLSAIDALSWNTRQHIGLKAAPAEMDIRKTSTALMNPELITIFRRAVEMALQQMRRDYAGKGRGAGHEMELSYAFVSDALRLYVMAGYSVVSPREDGVFAQWCATLAGIADPSLKNSGWRNAILRVVGRSEAERRDRVKSVTSYLARHWPEFALGRGASESHRAI